ncbi:MAG: bacillithiol system redox-active protein YtxJ [Bacteroidia bacterium]
MNIIPVSSSGDIDRLIAFSSEKGKTAVIFKHSTRCSISLMAWDRLQRQWNLDENTALYYLDLLQYRPISNEIAERFHVEHQSPQVLVIRNGNCIYHTSHSDITAEKIREAVRG